MDLGKVLDIIGETDKVLSGEGYPELERNGDFTLQIRVTTEDMLYMDRELYLKTNGSMDGYVKGDEIRMEMYGINVVISDGKNIMKK